MYNEHIENLFLSNDKVFYTVEGEGIYAGMPSVFMRLAMCNLTCIGFKSPDSPFGCDSYISWSVKNKMTFHDIYQELFVKTGYITRLENKAILKLTGGEPFIQQKQLLKFVRYLTSKMKNTLIIDFETNGTIKPDDEWFQIPNTYVTFTISPKLKSNGDPIEKRYIPDVLGYYATELKGNCIFKFVVQSLDDVSEILDNYVNKFGIQRDRVWLMPCCGSRKELIERSEQVAEMCKTYDFNYSSRLQLLIWDKALRV